jgi:hypothetical protein
MINSDNINVKLPQPNLVDGGDVRESRLRLRQLENWLKKNNIKYSIVYYPAWEPRLVPTWAHFPVAINMRKDDALIFKLIHNL